MKKFLCFILVVLASLGLIGVHNIPVSATEPIPYYSDVMPYLPKRDPDLEYWLRG